MPHKHIHILEPSLANQIAAGEVVERPCAVVKELLENSIDAKADKLDIMVEQGGIGLIRIRDNGCGISKEDLPLALQRHATSKIQSVDDLFCVRSLGFRGEALASISSVSRVTLTSREQSADCAWQIKMEGNDDSILMTPASHPYGTTIEISDLFFNVPARRKFLRTAQTEFAHILETVRRLALVHFDTAIYLQHNAKSILRFDISKNQKDDEERLVAICGEDFVKQAVAIAGEATDMRVHGWIGLPSFTRSQADLQYFYVNGRSVRDKTLSHAVRQSYQDAIAAQRYPGLVLFLDVDPALVDVNVHPTKSEVRFREARAVHDFITQILRKVLATGRGTTVPDIYVAEKKNKEYDNAAEFTAASTSEINEHCERARNFASNQNAKSISEREETQAYSRMGKTSTALQQLQVADLESPGELLLDINSVQSTNKNLECENNLGSAAFSLGNAIGQVQNKYIVAQNSQGLIIVDAHAAHERITYEKLKANFWQDKIMQQELLQPVVFTVSLKEAECVEMHQETLRRVGLELARAGQTAVMLRSLPTLLLDANMEQLVRDVIADFIVDEKSFVLEKSINKILATMACHTSVRAGRSLSMHEMRALLRQIEQTEFGGQCGHGRPTWIELITFAELQKKFSRKEKLAIL